MKLNIGNYKQTKKILKYLMPKEDLSDYFQRHLNTIVNDIIKVNYRVTKKFSDMEDEFEKLIDSKNNK